MAKYKFRVKAGAHHSKGRTYKTGEIVESDTNLAETFKEKFEKVDIADPAPLVAVGSKQDGAVTERPTTSDKAPYTPKGAGRAVANTPELAKQKQASDPSYDEDEDDDEEETSKPKSASKPAAGSSVKKH